jgi:HPt (histidine-containing phosphotransfer) domain-containing protein
MTDTTLIDRGVLDGLLESLGGDLDFLAELLQTYFDDSPQQIAAMRAAVAAGDAEALRRAAHSLKSNSANFGALALSAKCKELEMVGKAGTVDGAADKIAVVAADYEQVRAALEAMQRDK